MIAIANQTSLYLLEFIDRYHLKREIEMLQKKTKSRVVFGREQPIDSIERELKQYFKADLYDFKTPFTLVGSVFQSQVWSELGNISSNTTVSYSHIAQRINNPLAVRAVATAVASNQLAIIIPCHRVIHSNGNLGGYSGGFERKKWLLDHESKMSPFSTNTEKIKRICNILTSSPP
jgi:AraC family transcriptional regulator of adaptative response/methylated-DNA-[protein]-cysteine methyltransferase